MFTNHILRVRNLVLGTQRRSSDASPALRELATEQRGSNNHINICIIINLDKCREEKVQDAL